MRIFGIDPGYGRCGFAVIDVDNSCLNAIDYGVITTLKDHEHADRLVELAADIEHILEKYKPDLLAIEELFFAKNTTTALKVAGVRGIVIMLARKAGLGIVEVKPSHAKLAVTGHGRADKRQMQEMTRRIFELEHNPRIDDAADALAIAYTGSQSPQIGVK